MWACTTVEAGAQGRQGAAARAVQAAGGHVSERAVGGTGGCWTGEGCGRVQEGHSASPGSGLRG